MSRARLVRTDVLVGAPKRFLHDRLALPDGEEIDWYYLDTPASVVVVPITAAGNVVLVRQYRYNLRRDTLELPAGLVVGDEAPAAAAERELREETGYGRGRAEFEALGEFYCLPSETNKQVHVFLAVGVEREGPPLGDAAIEKYFGLRVEEVPLPDAVGSVGSGLQGIETTCALMLAWNRLGK